MVSDALRACSVNGEAFGGGDSAAAVNHDRRRPQVERAMGLQLPGKKDAHHAVGDLLLQKRERPAHWGVVKTATARPFSTDTWKSG